MVYRYDAQGRLILARDLAANGWGTPYGYDAAGAPYADTITANLGAAVHWVSSQASGGSSTSNQWSGTLQAGQTSTLAFAVRESELASSVRVPGASGAVILAIASQFGDAASTLQVTGATVLGSTRVNGVQTTLVRVSEAGLKLIRLQGTGAAQIRVSIAGDMNRDGVVDGQDSGIWEQAAANGVALGDINGDGQVNATDRQVLYANYGFRANMAPVAQATLPVGKTHTDLATSVALSTVAQDLEGDAIFWRVLRSTHGTASLAGDGQTLLFTPDAGYSGLATVTVQADDGFAAGGAIAFDVNVSGAALRDIRITRLPTMNLGSSGVLQVVGDFADQADVELTGRYATIQSDNVAAVSSNADGVLLANQEGIARITASARGLSAQNVITVGTLLAAPSIDRYDNELNVYPISIDLPQGVGQRQIDVHTLDGSMLGTDIGKAADETPESKCN